MFHFLTEAAKRRIIMELRRFWAYHPKYPDIVDNIQGKYSFKERPSYGIILKASSANTMQLSADNFLGTVESYVMLTRVGDSPGLSVEWVREDARAIQENDGVFPSAPGVYYAEVLVAENAGAPYSKEPVHEFYVDPLLDVRDESLSKTGPLEWQATRPFLAGSLRLYEMPGSIPMVEGVNYTADADAGAVTVTQPVPPKMWLSADYRYPAPSTGPWRIAENFATTGAIPGVVLAFGRRVTAGDRFAVVVTDRRQPTALEYGGRWEISIDLDVTARDVQSQQEIADATVMYLWGIARLRLSTEGIELTTVSMGGESEEVYDENGDDYFYNASLSLTLNTDWAVHVPLDVTIRKVSPQTTAQADLVAAMTDAELSVADPDTVQNIAMLESLGLRYIQDPQFFLGGRTPPREVIR